MKLSLITLVAASVVYSYSYQVVKQDFLHNTELGKKKHQLNNSKETRNNQLTGNTGKEQYFKNRYLKRSAAGLQSGNRQEKKEKRRQRKNKKERRTPTKRHELKQHRQSKNKLASPRKSETVTDSSSIKQSI